MTAWVLACLILGHFLGDYVFQNNWMALKKNQSTFRCLIHCLIYTTCVCMLTAPTKPLWWVAVFLSHFPIDRWSLADKWARLYHSRSIDEFMKNGWADIPYNPAVQRILDETAHNYHAARGGFTAAVYIAIDNTMHFALMLLAWRLIMR